jgi:hypothetical protein
MNVTIRPESIEDLQSIWHVNQAAFEGDAEANLVDALRDGGFVDVSMVAEVDGKVVGHSRGGKVFSFGGPMESMLLKQLLEKLSNEAGAVCFIEFQAPKSIDFISRKLQFSISRYHLGVELR